MTDTMKTMKLKVNFSDADRFVPDYSNNVVVTHDAAKVYLAFFHTPPPMILGEAIGESIEEKVIELYPNGIKSVCVARICLDKKQALKTSELIAKAVKAIQDNPIEDPEDG